VLSGFLPLLPPLRSIKYFSTISRRGPED